MTLLRYGLTSDPFPLKASPATGDLDTATLTIVASNPNPDPDRHPVTLQYLSIVIPTGQDPTDLTADDKVDSEAPAGWNPPDRITSTGKVKYVFHPIAGGGQVKGAGLNFILKNIPLSRLTGTVEIDVIEGSEGDPTQQFLITKFPNGWGEVSFRVVPDEVPLGGATTLQWSGPDTANYAIDYWDPQQNERVNLPQPGQSALASTGQYPGDTDAPLILGQTTTFTLTVTATIANKPFQAQVQKTLTVDVPRDLDIHKFECSADAFSVLDVVTLRWQVAMANSCTLTVDGASGSVAVDAVDDILGAWNSCQVKSDDGITLIVSKTDGSGVELGRITLPTPVPEAVTFRLSAAASEVIQQTFVASLLRPQLAQFDQIGNYFYMVWQTANAHVSITPLVGAVAASGRIQIDNVRGYDAANVTVFTISCIGFGETQSRTITVPATDQSWQV